MSRIHEALRRAEQDLVKGTDPVTIVEDGSLAPMVTDVRQISAEFESKPVTKFEPTTAEVDQHWLDSLPLSPWTPDPKRVLFSDPQQHSELGMEEFRTLRSRLYQIREKRPLKVIMLSSAISGEGKTFVASNLAFALARQQGRRVLLIDADVRKPLIHESIGTTGTPGLNDYLAGKVEPRSIIQRGTMENLYLIPGGQPVSNPSELVANGKMGELLTQVRPFFDWILLDSPPLVSISDGSVISRNADGTLLVIKVETTPVHLVELAKNELKGIPVLGAILNRGERKSSLYSGYQYAYTHSEQK